MFLPWGSISCFAPYFDLSRELSLLCPCRVSRVLPSNIADAWGEVPFTLWQVCGPGTSLKSFELVRLVFF